MSALAVKTAAAVDVAWIGALARSRTFAAKWSDQALAAELSRPDSIFLAAAGEGGARGYAVARVVDADCRLLDLAASTDGAGLGRALLSGLTEAAKARACSKISFEASASNSRALAFYAKAGAKVVGRRLKFYYDGSDAVLMDLDLP